MVMHQIPLGPTLWGVIQPADQNVFPLEPRGAALGFKVMTSVSLVLRTNWPS